MTIVMIAKRTNNVYTHPGVSAACLISILLLLLLLGLGLAPFRTAVVDVVEAALDGDAAAPLSLDDDASFLRVTPILDSYDAQLSRFSREQVEV